MLSSKRKRNNKERLYYFNGRKEGREIWVGMM
jgi:hypothetical protein